MNKIIFVCTGNTCRSPIAEILFKSMASDSELEVISRGLVVLFPEPANPKAEVVCVNHNLKLDEHVARMLKQGDITEDTLILTMTLDQARRVMEHFENAGEVYTLKEFVGESGDVADPYGGALPVYEDCFAELTRLVKKLVYKLGEV